MRHPSGVPRIDIGISEIDRRKIADGLGRLLADTYTLYLKTHNFHWNVTGPMFQTLHLMFEEQYNELATAVDLIAERIRALGFPAPGSYREFMDATSIRDAKGDLAATEMVRDLVEGQEAVGAHRALDSARGQQGGRPADDRSAHTAPAGTREGGVDAAQPPRTCLTDGQRRAV
jgi:starvation-inducible DNA-binding protein